MSVCWWPSEQFLAAVNPIGSKFGLALADLTTGDFFTTEIEERMGF